MQPSIANSIPLSVTLAVPLPVTVAPPKGVTVIVPCDTLSVVDSGSRPLGLTDTDSKLVSAIAVFSPPL